MARQPCIDDFSPKKVLEGVEASIVREASGTLRLKMSIKVAKELGLPDKGDFRAVVRGERFTSRYDTTAGLRLRIPSEYTCLFNGWDGGRIRVDLWVEDGVLCMSYKPDERLDFYPASRQPFYSENQGFCSYCQEAFLLSRLEKAYCPHCGKKLREKPRKGRKDGDVKRYDFDFGEDNNGKGS